MFSTFMTNTWIVATIVAAVAGFVGFFVVLRGNAFAAHALPLGSFPGAALAHLLGIDEIFGLIAFAVLGVVGIARLSRHDRQDVATALCLMLLLGCGALFLSMTASYSQAIYALLFGEVFGIAPADILLIGAMAILSIAGISILFRPLLLSALAPEAARIQGISPQRLDIMFLSILALSAVTALPVVGALLVFTLMVGPPALARSMTDRPLKAMLLSCLIAVMVTWASVALSYTSNWPLGLFVGISCALCYGLGRVLREWRRPRIRASGAH